MIIPIKCFTCGFVISDKYRYYQKEVRERKFKNPNDNIKTVLYLTKEFRDKTIEGIVLDEIGIIRMCCRRHFLTHVDIE
jgi:DNA-directed RNA polymerase I, II, and III subunit RPABC5